MKRALNILAFPFIFLLSLIQVICKDPFALHVEKDRIKIGIVPIIIIVWLAS